MNINHIVSLLSIFNNYQGVIMLSILKRRSIRKYTDQRVSDDKVEQLLRAGMSAPSAGNGRPWHFIVIDDKEILSEIPKFHPYSNMLKEASHAIVVCGNKGEEKFEGYWVQDCSAATENILLMAEELGLGAVWLGVYPEKERVMQVQALLHMPNNVVPLSIVSIGYPAETKESINRFYPEKIHKNKW